MKRIKVAFYGTVSDINGYGTSARSYIHALHRAGIELSVINLGFFQYISEPSGGRRPMVDLGSSQNAPDSLVGSLLNRWIDPDFHLINYGPLAAIPLALYWDKVIMATSLEADTLPVPWLNVLNKVREIWAPCQHNVSVFQKGLNVPVINWPKAIHPQFGTGWEADFSVLPQLRDSDFVFYSVFVWQKRKNPDRLIEAFLRAFPRDRGVVLILKTLDLPSEAAEMVAKLREDVGSSARIEIINGVWTLAQIEALAQRGNCYVSLHHGEGWCNPLFDAACRAKPVVATSYGGPLDYLDPDAHCLIRHRLVPVNQIDEYYNDKMKWAEPDLDHAVELMRKVYEQREHMGEKARGAAARLRRRYSSEAVGKLARDRLEQLL